EPLANSSRLGKHLLKARRECAGDGNLLVGGRIHHEPEQQCPALRIVRQMNASNVRHGESVRLTDLILWVDDCISAEVKRGIYPGSFEQVTNGHLAVAERAR